MSFLDREARTCPECGRRWEALTFWAKETVCGKCATARYRQRLAEINAARTFTVEEIGGGCPTQAQGRTAAGRPFYFRARHGDWTLELGQRGAPTSYVKWPLGTEELIAEGDDPSGGFMETDDVLAILDAHFADGAR